MSVAKYNDPANSEIRYRIVATRKRVRIRLYELKVGLLPSRQFGFICFNESPLKMMKSTFYFILKARFVLKIFKFLF